MKKMFALFLVLSMVFCGLAAAEEDPDDIVYVDGLFRFVIREDNTAELISYSAPLEETVDVPGTLTTRGYVKKNKEVEPVKYEDMKQYVLTSVRGSVFGYNRNLKKLTLPDSVTYIGPYGFSFCENLTDLRLPQSLTCIEEHLFDCCFSLPAVTIPDSVTSIGDNAFYSCRMLQAVRIPDSVISIGNSAFMFCESLTEISLPAGLTAIGDKTFSSCGGITAVRIPDKVTRIGNEAFSYCESLSSVVIPEGVESIGDYAFEYCRALTGLALPDSLKELGANPFSRCEKLSEITVSADHPVLECSDGVVISKPDRRLVSYPIARENPTYIIPEGIGIIGDRAFESCFNLGSVRFPDSLTRIGNEAFSGTSLQGTIPDEMTDPDEMDASIYRSLKEFRLPENLESIGDSAFYFSFNNGKSTTDIIIPDSLTELGRNPFESCKGLSFIISPDHPRLETVDGDLVTKGDKTLICHIQKPDETEYTTPPGIEYIGAKAFANNRDLTRIELSEGVLGIGYMAFDLCENVTAIVLPDSLKAIDDAAFFYCRSLTEITLPAGLESIGDSLFFGISDLTVNIYPDSYAARFFEENWIPQKLNILEP